MDETEEEVFGASSIGENVNRESLNLAVWSRVADGGRLEVTIELRFMTVGVLSRLSADISCAILAIWVEQALNMTRLTFVVPEYNVNEVDPGSKVKVMSRLSMNTASTAEMDCTMLKMSWLSLLSPYRTTDRVSRWAWR